MPQLAGLDPTTAPAPSRARAQLRGACRVVVATPSWLASHRRVVVPLMTVLALVVAIIVTGLVAVGWLVVAAAAAVEALVFGVRR